MVTCKYYGIYMAYPFVGKLAPRSSGRVHRKMEHLAPGAKFGQRAEYL
jgi:hypothetical protein